MKGKLYMKNQMLFYKYEICRTTKKILNIENSFENLSRHLGNKTMLTAEETNNLIYQAVLENRPFFAGRYGGFEIATIVKYLENRISDTSDLAYYLKNNAGFFPKEKKQIEKFARLYLKASEELNLIGRHWNGMEDYIIRSYAPASDISAMFYLEPWYPGVTIPWTAALKGKNVLIVHPFEASIRKQYATCRKTLFNIPEILPDFKLKTFKAIQTSANCNDNRFNTWFDALDYMYDKIIDIEFDIAIIGCGAYGFPLAARLKRSGKVAIHMGGVLQILFGIKGNRWETHSRFDYVKKLFNDSWIYPLKEDQPSEARTIENGCYWNFDTSEKE